MSSPSLVPEADHTIYLVMCDYGPAVGRAFIETDPDAADRETIIQAIADGEYTKVAEVWAIDLAAGTPRNVTKEIMASVEQRGTIWY